MDSKFIFLNSSVVPVPSAVIKYIRTCTEILLTTSALEEPWNEVVVVKCRVPILFRPDESTDGPQDKQLLWVMRKYISISLRCTDFYSLGQ